MLEIVRKKIDSIKYKYRIHLLHKEELINKDFTIISDNCLAGVIYNDLGLKFNTPTIGMFIFGPDYVKFTANIHKYLSLPFYKLEKSKYIDNVSYPLAVLGDCELHLLHYKSFEDARDKWIRRVKRVNYDNLFFSMTDRDFTTYRNMKDFDTLKQRKVIYSSKNYKDLKSLVWCKRYKYESTVGLITNYAEYSTYHNIIKWLNS